MIELTAKAARVGIAATRPPAPLAAVQTSAPPAAQGPGRAAAPGAYGHRMAEAFGLDTAPTLTTTRLKTAQMAATRLNRLGGGSRVTTALAPENACLVTLQLHDLTGAKLFKAGECVAQGPLPEGSVSIVHLGDEPTFQVDGAFDALQFYVPQILFGELASDCGAPAITDLAFQWGAADPVIHQLGRALLSSLANPAPEGRLFFDHIALAVHAHLASQYGLRRDQPLPTSRRLTAWQERTAKELLGADLMDEPAIADIAVACGLAPGQFARAFRRTTGMPPHRWLRGFRIERAKELLFNSSLSLAQIAYDCGFADQSHFSRVFTTAIGVPPGAWRRSRCG